MKAEVKRLTHMGQGRIDVPKIDPHEIIVRSGKDYKNYRDVSSAASKAHIAWLVESIKLNGVQKPLEVEFDKGKVYLVDGECRLKAALIVKKTEPGLLVPVVQVYGDEAEILARMMTANGGLPPTNMEFGAAAKRLRDLGWTDDQILAVCPPHIKMKGNKQAKRITHDAIDLSNAPLAIKKAVKEGIDGVAVSESAALSALRKHGKEEAFNVLEKNAKKAKATGKKKVARGKAVSSTEALLIIADQLVELVLTDGSEWDGIADTARAFKSQRKINAA